MRKPATRVQSSSARTRPLRCIGLFIGLSCFTAVPAAPRPPSAALATAHPMATEAGREILAAGGNAFDAAVAITAALAVVEPSSSGLGGGGFWLLHRAAGKQPIVVDGRERAPLAAHADMYLDEHGEVIRGRSIDGPLAAAIPGAPAALAHLAAHYGRLPLGKSLAPAIRYAEDGFPADARYLRLARFRLEALRRNPAVAEVFLDNGELPAEGTIIRQTDLARTLRTLAREGAHGFYRGALAERLVAGVREAGGIWSLRDLAEYHVVEREPIVGHYRGLRIVTTPPPSSGGVALVTMLNILSAYDLTTTPSVTRTHLVVEAMRRAYRDRAVYLGDPDYVKVPVEELTDPRYAAGLRAGIHPSKATPSALLPGAPEPEPDGGNTTHFSVLDRAGNRVAATLSINFPFGAAFMVDGTGVLLNDEMDDFSAKAAVPNVYGLIGGRANAIEAGKRPLSSMTPTFLESERQVAVLGTPGGSRIISMVLLATLGVSEGTPAEIWIKSPRYHHQFIPDLLFHEPGAFTAEQTEALEGLGYHLRDLGRRYGNMQVVLWDLQTPKVLALSDPRGIGRPLVESPPPVPH